MNNNLPYRLRAAAPFETKSLRDLLLEAATTIDRLEGRAPAVAEATVRFAQLDYPEGWAVEDAPSGGPR
jgi:hypothetical protein